MRSSAGFTSQPDGGREPKYDDFPEVPAQVQPLSTSDIRRMDGLNLTSIMKAVYLMGKWDGVSRPAIKGGDLMTLPDGSIWLVTIVLEAWSDWTKVAVTQQVKK